MPRRIILSVFAIAVTGMPAGAADLPPQSRLGAIFAEPSEVRPYTYRPREYSPPIIGYNLLPGFAWARGGYYYGSRDFFFYACAYYGWAVRCVTLPLPRARG